MRSCRQLRLRCWRSAVERPPCRKRTSTLPTEIQGTQLPLTLVKTTLHLLAFFFFFLVRYMLASIQIMSGIQICLTLTMGSKFYQFSSVQFKVIPMRLGKPICVPPHLSGVSPLLPLKHQWSWSRGIKRGSTQRSFLERIRKGHRRSDQHWKKCCADLLSVCPTPLCICTHKNDHVCMLKIL